MPTLLKWTYDGGAPDSAEAARRGEQRAFSGDKAEDDVFGTGVLDTISGSSAFINFGTAEAKDIKQRTAEHVYVLVQRPVQCPSWRSWRSFAISAAYALGRPTAGRRLPSIISVSRRSLTSERGRGVSGVRGVWGGGQYIDLLY